MFSKYMKTVDIRLLFQNARFVLFINIVLGLLLVPATVVLLRDVISTIAPSGEEVARTGKKAPPAVTRNLQDYAAILRNNPFGFPAGELKPISPLSGPSSASQADLTLIATVAGSRSVSYAIFADKTGAQDVFRVGQQVYGLGTLGRVEKDRVFINAKGKDIELPLAEITPVREIRAAEANPAAFGKKTGESSYHIDQQKVQQAIDRPAQIMTDARFVPNFINGRQQGFELREVKPGGIYSSLGLQNGDVLLRINEFTISNPESALQAFTALKGIDRAQLDIIRGGSRMTMTYQIR